MKSKFYSRHKKIGIEKQNVRDPYNESTQYNPTPL
jgi:hypothetical protein